MTKKRTQKKERVSCDSNKGSKLHKKKGSYHIGGNIDKISNKVELLLVHDTLDFLPTSNIVNNNADHYLNMIDFIRLQKLVDDNPKFKRSRTIQFIFDYNSYQVEELDKIVFSYKNINCNSLVDKKQMNYYVKLLFLYLLECNKVREGDMGGGAEKELSNVDIKPDDLNEVVNDGDDKASIQENVSGLIGFDEYESKRIELERIYIQNTGLVYYELDWFHVCIGYKRLDKSFEDEVISKLKVIGIILDDDVINDKVKEVMKDKDLALYLKESIKSRMLSCSSKPLTFFDNIFKTISYSSLKVCDKRDRDDSLLYLYDGYESLLNDDISTMSKLDMVIFLSYCEIRQLILSKNISLEMVRRSRDNTSEVMDILNKIYKLDKKDIKNDNMILDTRLKRENEYEKKLIRDMKMKRDGQNIRSDISASNDLYNGLYDDLDVRDTEDFINHMKGEVKKDEVDIVMNKLSGGNLFNVEPSRNDKECNLMKQNKNIYLYQIPFINNC